MKKYSFVFLLCLFFLAVLAGYETIRFHDNKLHIIFCNVGQGDAMLIRTPAQKYLLIDSGPDASVLECLSRYLPFWERRIDLALLSHGHDDHAFGLTLVLQHYQVGMIAESFLTEKPFAVSSYFLTPGEVIVLDTGMQLAVLGPQKGQTGENVSTILRLTYGGFSFLTAGDSPAANIQSDPVVVLQLPHHGSNTSTTEVVLSQLRPQLAVISVGKNTYGHPHQAVLSLLHERGIQYFRTDKHGTIEIVTDGNTWEIKTEKNETL